MSTCEFANCLAPNNSPGTPRHSWNHHVVPVPFRLLDQTRCFRVEGGRLICPVPGCATSLNRRDRATKHMREAHSLGGGVPIFEGPGLAPKENEVRMGESASRASGVIYDANANGDDTEPQQAERRAGEKSRDKGVVTLDPEADYLEGGGVLDVLGIWFHRGLEVFICRACQVGLTWEVVKGHCKGQHQLGIATVTMDALKAFQQGHHVYRRPEDVPLPRPGGPVVQGLSAPEDGLACGTVECRYSVKDEGRMRKHQQSEHRRGGPLQELTYRECKVQTLFQGVGKAYFEVQGSAKEGEASRLLEALKQVGVSSDEGGATVIATDKDRTPPALLRITGWADHLPEVRGNKALRAKALNLKAKRGADELGGILPGLEATIDAWFDSGRRALEGYASKLTALKMLIHGENIPSEGARHWKALPASNEDYPAFVKELATAIIRSRAAGSTDDGFAFVLSEEQDSTLRMLADALRQKDAVGAAACWQNFIWKVASAKVEGGWTDVTQQWMWLRALRADGNFYGASSFTPDLAKLKYVMRQTTLLQAFVEPFESEEELLERVGMLHASALRLGTARPFNMVTELSQFASSLAFSEVKDPKVTISEDYQWFTVGTQTMSLDRLREGLAKLIDQIWLAYRNIMESKAIVQEGIRVVDDLSNDSRGYSFLEESPFRERRRNVFNYLVGTHELATLDCEGKLCWDIPRVKSLLSKCERMWDNVLHLLFMTLGVSTRVAQFLRMQLRNGDRQRNVQFRNGEMFFVTRDSKTSNAAGRDSCIPSFPPSQASRLLLELVGGGLREAEALLVGVVHGAEAMELHRTYLCMQGGKRLEAEQFYARFAGKNRELFDCAWGSRDYRQAAIAMARHFISSDATFKALDDALAEAADHSVDVDHAHYGRAFGDHPTLTHSDLEKQRWICQEWHSFLGLGPFPVQEPIAAVRSRGGSARVDKEAMKFALSEILPELSSTIADAVMKKLERLLPTTVEDAACIASTSHANALPAPSGPQAHAAVEPAVDTDVETEDLRTSAAPAPACVRTHDPAAADNPPDITRPLCDPPPASAGPPSCYSGSRQNAIFAGGHEDEPHTTPPANSGMRVNAPGQPAKGRRVLPRSFSSVLDLTVSSPCPAPRQRDTSHRKPSPVPTEPEPSSQPVAPMRKRRAPEPVDCQWLVDDDEATEDSPPKRVRLSTNPQGTEQALDALFAWTSDDLDLDLDFDSMADFIAPSTPDSMAVDAEETIRQAIRDVLGDPNAREKSRQQMDAIMAIVYEEPRDLAVVVRTGGGKSLLWTVPALLGIDGISVVICPFKSLLEEQYQRCVQAGVRCHSYGLSKQVPEGVQNLFVQVEHVGMQVFQNLLATPLGKRIQRVFVDEFHDVVQCHPDRRNRWQALAAQCKQMSIQLILLSATCPPSMTDKLLRPFSVRGIPFNIIRGPTDRPEIGIHYIRTMHSSNNTPLHSIVRCLHKMLAPEERMLVFFNSKTDTAKFAKQAQCAMYHGDLPEFVPGNTKQDNIQRWDAGETKVMACTTGFAQGVDRPHVRFVVMKDPEYGLLVTMQMIGRAGRDGKESHAVIVDTEGGVVFPTTDLTASTAVKRLLGSDACKVKTTTSLLDGADHRYECRQRGSRVPCDVCGPRHPIHRAVLAASKTVDGPIIPLSGTVQPVRTGGASGSRPQAKEPPLSRVIVRPACDALKGGRQPTPSQDSDDLYGPAVIDPAMSWELGRTEGRHGAPLELQAHGELFRSSTLGDIPRTSNEEWKVTKSWSVLNRSASQAEGTSAQRAAEAQSIKKHRLQRTVKLNKYAPLLRGKCMAHLLMRGEICDEHHPRPCSDVDMHGPAYQAYRTRFRFKAFAYCFKCGLPQDRNFNGEGPECHRAYTPGGKEKCPFQHIIFKAAFLAGHLEDLAEELWEELGIPGSVKTVQRYLDWLTSEEEADGRYHNAIEVFLWCCERLEKRDPTLFL